jgi:hypothetical protein
MTAQGSLAIAATAGFESRAHRSRCKSQPLLARHPFAALSEGVTAQSARASSLTSATGSFRRERDQRRQLRVTSRSSRQRRRGACSHPSKGGVTQPGSDPTIHPLARRRVGISRIPPGRARRSLRRRQPVRGQLHSTRASVRQSARQPSDACYRTLAARARIKARCGTQDCPGGGII